MSNDGNDFSGLTTMVPRSVDVEVFHVTSENFCDCMKWIASFDDGTEALLISFSGTFKMYFFPAGGLREPIEPGDAIVRTADGAWELLSAADCVKRYVPAPNYPPKSSKSITPEGLEVTELFYKADPVSVIAPSEDNVEACLAWVASHGGETMIDPNDSVALFFVGFGKKDWQPVYDDEWLGVNSSGDFFEIIPSEYIHWFHPITEL